MKRVHEGLPIHVLPMRAPETNEGQLLGKISPQGGTRQTQSAVEQLLEGIFGSTGGTRTSGGTTQDAKERQDRQLNNRESR